MKIRGRSWTVKIERDRYSAVLLSSAVWFIPLRSLLIKFGNMYRSGWGGYLSKISIMFFFFFVVIPVLPQLSYTKDFMAWVFFVTTSWIVSCLSHLGYLDFWIGEAVDIFVRALPFYLLIQNIDDWTNVKTVMYKSSAITIVIMLIYTIIEQWTGTLFAEGYKYNQYNGMIMAGAATLCMIAFLDEKKKQYLFLIAGAFVMLVIFGARMPIACMLLAFGFYFIIEKVKNNIGKTELRIGWKKLRFELFIAALLAGIGIVVFKLQSVHMNQISAGQRILYQISNGEFFKSEGRSQIAEAAYKAITERPILGYGIIADRMPIAEYIFGDPSKFAGNYAHNVFLELWMQYGLLLGNILSMIILYEACKLILFNRFSRDKQMIGIYIVSMVFGILLFSGPNYSHKEFWMMLGMGAAQRNKIHKLKSRIDAIKYRGRMY